ncbi:hypothetical protein A2U01_0028130, partial [Trifolium medium]|nr:hypothetical protein [Trifolium medium]
KASELQRDETEDLQVPGEEQRATSLSKPNSRSASKPRPGCSASSLALNSPKTPST